jgi:hypothetical protein
MILNWSPCHILLCFLWDKSHIVYAAKIVSCTCIRMSGMPVLSKDEFLTDLDNTVCSTCLICGVWSEDRGASKNSRNLVTRLWREGKHRLICFRKECEGNIRLICFRKECEGNIRLICFRKECEGSIRVVCFRMECEGKICWICFRKECEGTIL